MRECNWKTEEKNANIDKNEKFESISSKQQNKYKIMKLPLKRYHKSDMSVYNLSGNDKICSKSEINFNEST